jgi:hypothetical protein
VRAETGHPLEVVCRVLGAPRSTVYARRQAARRLVRWVRCRMGSWWRRSV